MLIKGLFIFLLISPSPLLGDSSIRNVFFETRRALFRSKSCFCFQKPVSHIDINELIDPNRNGLERLVVYFYKDIKTNELKMYTPNVEKQRLIPNLASEGGDYLNNVTSQELFDYFNSNPNVVDASSVYDKDLDISISKEPLSYNIGEIEDNPANIKTIPDFNRYLDQANYVNNIDINQDNVNVPNESYSTDVSFVQAHRMTPIKQPLSVTTTSIYAYPYNVYSNVVPNSQPPLQETEHELENIENLPITEQVISSYFSSNSSQSSQSPLYQGTTDSALMSSGYLEVGNEGSDDPETGDLPFNQSLSNSSEAIGPTLIDHVYVVNDHAGLGSEDKPDMIQQGLSNQNYSSHKFSSHNKTPNTTVKYICAYRNCKSEQKRPIVNISKRIIPGREYAPHRSYKHRKELTRKHVKSNKLTTENSQKTNKKGEEVKPRRFLLARLLSKVLALLGPDVTNDFEMSETNKTEDKAMSQLLESDYEEENEEENEIEDDKDSMFRIIGGTPATGSGAPLNVRGRRFSN